MTTPNARPFVVLSSDPRALILPQCCARCLHHDWVFLAEWPEGHRVGHSCRLNIWFPVRKQTCARQETA